MTEVAEWLPLIEKNLEMRYGKQAAFDLKWLLKNTQAIIAGGFVLQSIANFEVFKRPDLDIYVSYQNMPIFLGELNRYFKFKGYRHFDATIYCRSFLRKNGIRRVHTFQDTGKLSIDVMSVRGRKTPQEVCSNFDLTFCQVWYNGTSVFATHPEHIKEKKGYLQGDYIQTFAKGNVFLQRRMKKYKDRGFTISYDPAVSTTIPSIEDVLDKQIKCVADTEKDERLQLWFNRVVTRWLTTNPAEKAAFSLPLGWTNTQTQENQEFLPGEEVRSKYTRFYNIAKFKIPDDEGYDSEDMDLPKLKQLNVRTAGRVAIDIDLNFGRSIFGLLERSLTDRSNKIKRWLGTFNFGKMLEQKHRELEWVKELAEQFARGDVDASREWTEEKIQALVDERTKSIRDSEIYLDVLKQNGLRVGTDFAADEGQLYDIHEHPADAATTRDSLEGYLEQFIRMADKSDGVPCYHKPVPVVRGQPEPAENCKQRITVNEIMTICSYEFQKRFFAPQPVKTGLNVIMPYLEAALPNVKTLEEGYGDEFHDTMCPFCLQPMNRGEGCSYMTHENPKRLDSTQAPFCQPEYLIEEILDGYRDWGNKIHQQQGEFDMPLHIEVCVECGRPCLGHQHFDLNSDPAAPQLVPALKMPDPNDPTRMIFDYATCSGGGRAELIARMLAVRDVYKANRFTKPYDERRAAAFAAENAAKDPAYLDRARAILAMSPEERKFNVEVPATKKYNDPAYADEEEAGVDEDGGEKEVETIETDGPIMGGTRKGRSRRYGRTTFKKQRQVRK